MGNKRFFKKILVLIFAALAFSAFAKGKSDKGQQAGQNVQQTAEQSQATLLAEQRLQKAKEVEPAITAALKSIESEKAHLEGLEFRLKSVESLTRKIITDSHDMEVSLEEAAANIKDVLRYTLVIEENDYTEITKKTLDKLTKEGYSVYSFKNFWAKDNIDYQGINTNLKTPDGVIFELQFHTKESYDTKSEKTHKYYEIIRSESASDEEKAEASRKHHELFALVPVPAGAKELSYPTSK